MSALLEPACPRAACRQPVTVAQQQAGKSRLVYGVGVYHDRCHGIEMMRVEIEVRRAFDEGVAA